MTITDCPKCGYARQPSDVAPLTECPKCGVVFFKYSEATTKKAAAAAEPKPGPSLRSRMQAASEAFTASQQARETRPSSTLNTALICKQCGTAHQGERVLPGNGWIEFVLYFAYVFPGIIYSIWRRSKRTPTCAACGSRDLVGLTTPVGRKLAREHYPEGIPPGPPAPPPAPPAVRPNVVFWLVAILAGPLLLAWLFSAIAR